MVAADAGPETAAAPRELAELSLHYFYMARVLWRIDPVPAHGAHLLRRSVGLLAQAVETLFPASESSSPDALSRAHERGLVSSALIDSGAFLDGVVSRIDWTVSDMPKEDPTEVERYRSIMDEMPRACRRLVRSIPVVDRSWGVVSSLARMAWLVVATPVCLVGAWWLLQGTADRPRELKPPGPGEPGGPPLPAEGLSAPGEPIPDGFSILRLPSSSAPNVGAFGNGRFYRAQMRGDPGKYRLRVLVHGTKCANPAVTAGEESPYAVLVVKLDGRELIRAPADSERSKTLDVASVEMTPGSRFELEMENDFSNGAGCDRNLFVDTIDVARVAD